MDADKAISRPEPEANGSSEIAVRLMRRSLAEISGSSWDAFAVACGASFREAWCVLRPRALRGGLQIYEFEIGQPGMKIAQCAVRQKTHKAFLLDRIHILPAFQHLWNECFRLLKQETRATEIWRGSLWNQGDMHPEPEGFDIRLLRRDSFHIDIIDFRDWGSFERYEKGVSKNVTRDFRKAANSGRVQLDTRRGAAAILSVPSLIRSRREVARKHGDAYKHAKDWVTDFIGTTAKILLFRNRAFITRATCGGAALATFFGIEFGDRLYYVTGGTIANREGAGSYLFLNVIRQWFETAPRGQFVFGHCMGDAPPSTYDEGALLYRRKLRATATPGVQEAFAVHAPGEATRLKALVAAWHGKSGTQARMRVFGPIAEGDYSRIYRIEFLDSTPPLVAKVCTDENRPDRPFAELQYREMLAYHQKMGGAGPFRVPQPFAVMPEHAVVLMEWVNGEHIIDEVHRRRFPPQVLIERAGRAGGWLRAFHEAGGMVPAKIDRDALELRLSPLRSSLTEKRWPAFKKRALAALESAVPRLTTPLPHTQLHGDFQLGNVMFGNDVTFGLDIGIIRPGVALTDVAHFLNDIEKISRMPRGFHLYRHLGKLVSAFEAGYFGAVDAQTRYALTVFRVLDELEFLERHYHRARTAARQLYLRTIFALSIRKLLKGLNA